MLTMTDLLTIALPVYKRTDFVKSALDSAVKQTVPCRILLIDNNSPHDDFKTILESYQNPLMTYHRNPETVPQDENFNNCFRFAETPWVTILHDDDMLHCQFVETAMRIFQQFGDTIGGFAVNSKVGEEEWDGIYVKKNLDGCKIREIAEPFYYFTHLSPFPGVVVRRDTALRLGGFTNKLFPIADFDFWYRYNQHEKMLKVEEKLAYYRISSTQSTVQAFTDMINNLYAYRKNIIGKGRHDNFRTRMGLEYARIQNIRYFKKTYSAFQSDEAIADRNRLKSAGRLLKIPFAKRLISSYIQKISYGNVWHLKGGEQN